MEGPNCIWLVRDLLYYTTGIQDNPLSQYTTPITEIESLKEAWYPKRIANPVDSYTRLTEELQCTTDSFEDPINEDPISILWQV